MQHVPANSLGLRQVKSNYFTIQQLLKFKDLNDVKLISTNSSVVCRDLLDLELSSIINTSPRSQCL